MKLLLYLILNTLFVNISMLTAGDKPKINSNIKSDDSVLPVELVYFYATVIPNGVQLNFGTATETNNYGFDIERSDSTLSFAAIGFVEGNGNSNSPKHYSYVDTLVEMSGRVYYRLKQIDFVGTFEYSDTVLVDFISSAVMTDSNTPEMFYLSNAYPNPFNHQTKIEFNIPESSDIKLEVFSLSGEKVKIIYNGYLSAGSYSSSIDFEEFGSGTYLLRLSATNFSSIKKVILLK